MCDPNPADEHIVDCIEDLTDRIRGFRGRTVDPGDPEFDKIIEAIAKLRASMNPTIIQDPQ